MCALFDYMYPQKQQSNISTYDLFFDTQFNMRSDGHWEFPLPPPEYCKRIAKIIFDKNYILKLLSRLLFTLHQQMHHQLQDSRLAQYSLYKPLIIREMIKMVSLL